MNSPDTEWFAIRARQPLKAAEKLEPMVDEIFLPKEVRRSPIGRERVRPAIPHVLFIRTSQENALSLESAGLATPHLVPRMWIYRYPQSQQIQPVAEAAIHLLRLLTNSDPEGCHVYSPRQFTPGQRVRVKGGPFEGYEGFVKRIKKNRHVIVEIQGLCMVVLPFIHPDLLAPLNEN